MLAQCTSVYIMVGHYGLGHETEDHAVTGYERWMEVGLPMLILTSLSLRLSYSRYYRHSTQASSCMYSAWVFQNAPRPFSSTVYQGAKSTHGHRLD